MTRQQMNVVHDAIEQARKFITLAELAVKNWNTTGPCRKNSAMKRASLDLSAALVEVRKPRVF